MGKSCSRNQTTIGMKHYSVIFFVYIFLTINLAFGADWSTNLVWSGGGLWTKRIPVAIENVSQTALVGAPVAVKLPITGVPAKDQSTG
jgi:hypothetical protein